MIVAIQGVAERARNIKDIQSQFKDTEVYTYIDPIRISSFCSFKKMLEIYPIDSNRLHIQDDALLSHQLESFLPSLDTIMNDNNIDLLSLYVPNRIVFNELYATGYTGVYEFKNFLGLVACVFSTKMQDIMRKELKNISCDDEEHDDVFVYHTLKKHSMKAYAHIPALVQHRIDMTSAMSHPATDKRVSKCFDINYVKNNI